MAAPAPVRETGQATRTMGDGCAGENPFAAALGSADGPDELRRLPDLAAADCKVGGRYAPRWTILSWVNCADVEMQNIACNAVPWQRSHYVPPFVFLATLAAVGTKLTQLQKGMS